MELLFLGTCACDYPPDLSSKFKGKFDFDARRSSCALLDGRYLIDCGEHALDSVAIAGVDVSKITDIFITHLHSDHFNAEHIETLAKRCAAGVRLWVQEAAVLPEIGGVEIKRMKYGETYGVNGALRVTGLNANHDRNAYPQHLYFETENERFLYALDGAWLLNETYYFLKNKRLTMLVLDATVGDYIGDYRIAEHNSIPMIRMMLPSLKKWGAITDVTKIYLSHLAPSLHKSHKETELIVQKDGLHVAYDGLRVEF